LPHELVSLARSRNLESLEPAWQKALSAPSPADARHYAAALDLLCEQDLAGRALGMATAMLEALVGNSHLDAALEVGFRVLRQSAHNDTLVKAVVELIAKRFGDESWYEVLMRRSGLDIGATVQAVQEFDRLRRYTKGHVVRHGSGWGEGVIDDWKPASEEVVVKFATGRREAFPLDTMLTSFKALDADDLRALKLVDIAKLQAEAESAPSVLLRRVAQLYRGTITSAQVKSELCESVVPEKAWATFWKKLKAAAAKDPWLKVEGSASRPVFVLRSRPVGIAQEAETALSHETDLGAKIGVLRDYLARGGDEEVRSQILALGTKIVESAIEEKKATHAHILDGILFLEEQGLRASVPAAAELRALLVKDDGSLRPTAIDRLATQASREHAISLLPQALGEHWADQCALILTEWPDSVVEKVVDRLVADGKGTLCLPIWDKVAPYPAKNQMQVYLLGRMFGDGVFDAEEQKPSAIAVVRVLLHTARLLNEKRKGHVPSSRLLARISSLLCGKRGLLNRAFETATRDDFVQYVTICKRAGEDFPQEIVDTIDRAVLEKHPDIHAEPEVPFWERDFIYTTKAGLARVKADYSVLVDEKIPANSKAIGAAAALGDLSENSEWESAMEEQRNLTGRAQEMDQQIRSARLIEDQEIPEGIVAPGVKVALRDETTGERMEYRVLGPWDVIDDHTVNYLAPIAQGLLGKQAGESGEIPTPRGPSRVVIESIERIV
jgi:transcription elongation factor GreA